MRRLLRKRRSKQRLLMLFLFITTLQLFRPGLGASAGDLNLRSRNKGSSTMVLPVRRRLRTKTPPTAETAPSIPQGSGGGLGPQSPGAHQDWRRSSMTGRFACEKRYLYGRKAPVPVSAHIEPRRAMAVLMNIGKPLQSTDNIFMTEWMAIFHDACRKLVDLARARARGHWTGMCILAVVSMLATIRFEKESADWFVIVGNWLGLGLCGMCGSLG